MPIVRIRNVAKGLSHPALVKANKKSRSGQRSQHLADTSSTSSHQTDCSSSTLFVFRRDIFLASSLALFAVLLWLQLRQRFVYAYLAHRTKTIQPVLSSRFARSLRKSVITSWKCLSNGATLPHTTFKCHLDSNTWGSVVYDGEIFSIAVGCVADAYFHFAASLRRL